MIKPKLLITGATGKTGGAAAVQLLAKGYPVRAFVHELDGRAERLRHAGAEIFPGSLEDFRDLVHAMQGVARAYFCPPLLPGTLRRATLFAAAAREAKLEAVVQLSQWVADPLHPAVHAREKWLSNQALSWLPGVGVVTVQPGWFADNYFAVIGQAAQFGLMALPLGEGLNAPPSNEDIARVIAACLVDPAPHIGKAYRPTGPRALAPAEIAAAIGKALRRPVRYRNAPISVFLKAATSLGLSDFVIAQLYWFLQDYQQNAFGVGAPTNVVEEIGGSPPEAFETIAARYVAAFPLAKRGLAGTMREGAGLLAALMARTPNIKTIETRFGAPRIANFALATESALWRSTHVQFPDPP